MEHLQKTFQHDRNIGIIFVYFRFGDTDTLTVEDLLASILKQLAQGHETLSVDIEDLYHGHSFKGTRPNLAEIAAVLQSEAKRYSKLYVLIDALDEYSEQSRTGLLRQLNSLFIMANILITSRPLENLVRQLRDSAQLEIEANIDDMRLYIKERIYESTLLSRALSKDPHLEEDIISQVTQNASKMYASSQLQY